MSDNVDLNEEIYSQIDKELDEAAMLIQNISNAYLEKKRNNIYRNEINLLKNKIHDILFENCEIIPEGVYLKIMDVLK